MDWVEIVMDDLKWKIVTWKYWRFLFFKLSKIEFIDDMYMKETYVYRFGK